MLIWAQQQKGTFFPHIIQVLSGKKGWIGYSLNNDDLLPQIRTGILECIPANIKAKADDKRVAELNFIYARDYSVITDIRIILRSLRKLG